MAHRLATILAATILAGCDPSGGEDDDDSGLTDTGHWSDSLEDGETECVDYAPVSETWETSADFAGDEIDVSAASMGSRGAGTLTAELTYGDDTYTGVLGLRADGATTLYAYSDDPEVRRASMEASLLNGETLDLVVYEESFSLNKVYPVPLTVTYTWTDIVDCFEDNNTEADARYLRRDDPRQGMLIGSFNQATNSDAGGPSARDDFFRVTVPDGASGLDITARFADPDVILEVVLYSAGEDPDAASELLVGSEFYPDEDTASLSRPPGEYFLRVREWGLDSEASQTQGYASPAGTVTERPSEWSTPYTLTVTAN